MCEVELLGNKEFVLRQQKYKVSEQLKTGEASVLFGEGIYGSLLNQLPLTCNMQTTWQTRSMLS